MCLMYQRPKFLEQLLGVFFWDLPLEDEKLTCQYFLHCLKCFRGKSFQYIWQILNTKLGNIPK